MSETLQVEAVGAISSDKIREVLLEVLADAAKYAKFTVTTLDDQIIATATGLVQRDLVWALLVRIIARNGPVSTAAELAAAIGATSTDGKPMAVGPVLIITLITQLAPVVLGWLKAFRDRRGNEPAPAVA